MPALLLLPPPLFEPPRELLPDELPDELLLEPPPLLPPFFFDEPPPEDDDLPRSFCSLLAAIPQYLRGHALQLRDQHGIPPRPCDLWQRMSMSWVVLVIAGLLEVCWAVGLKYTDGFRRPLPSILVIAAIAASMFLLSWAARTLPIGTAYAVWVGIGALGAAILGIVLFDEPLTAARMGFLALLLIAIVGLKATSQS